MLFFQKNELALTPHEAANVLDALNEWDEEIAPKELEENEVGLNAERYDALKAKLTKFLED
jgi:hypothetical protein